MGTIDPELLKRLDALAIKMNVTAQYLWGVLIKQAVFDGWADIVSAVFGLIIAVFFVLLTVHFTKNAKISVRGDSQYNRETRSYDYIGAEPGKYEWFAEKDTLYVIYLISGIIIAGIGLITFFINSYAGVNELYNPAYFALKYILKA